MNVAEFLGVFVRWFRALEDFEVGLVYVAYATIIYMAVCLRSKRV